ncbi:alpha/beta fold hydrolase [Amycolatopsis sp. cmx-4-54]|uniref:alpha/beta fold hydrolase n=1 Tax=Amycolatopsis sp. cmx-4-54 TaxID=2790936 RepID=UPI003979F2CD
MTNTPPLGEFQEIDGRRLYVHRSGDGGPAVVFLPGASAVGLDYFGVQQEVARFTTAVLYDRGGTGYSDALPLPRSATAVATELRELLLALGIAAPYVLAAHSLGGLYAHRFAQLYPRDVAGLVFLDALHPDWDDFMPPAASLAEAERPGPAPDRQALRAMHTELRAGYPDDVARPLIEAKVSDAWLRAGAAERTRLVALADELRAGPALPDVPMIALTVADPSPEIGEAKTKLDAARVSGFSRGEQRTLTGTAHHRLCFDRPDAVVQAVRDVVGRSR